MIGQLSLFGNRPRQPRPAGEPIYFAALPGGQLRTALPPVLERLRGDFGLRASSTPLDRLHVSVLGVGIAHQMPADDLAAVIAVTKAITVTPFQLSFTGVMSYRRSGGQAAPVVLIPDRGATQVAELAAQLAQAMIDQAVDPRGTLDEGPHMTLLYDRTWVPSTPLPAPIVVTIESVALIHSHWGKGRYSILAETPVKTAA